MKGLLSGLLVIILCMAGQLHAQTCNSAIVANTPDTRFTDNGDGTVTDVYTDLTWKRCVEGQNWDGATCSGTPSLYTWQQALQQADTINHAGGFAGQNDWYVPNFKDLGSIVERKCKFASINETIFPGTPTDGFWSASPYPQPLAAWLINFGSGYDFHENIGNGHRVRLVRGEQRITALPLPNFGLTIITHGHASGTDAWVKDMAMAIANQGKGVNLTPIYNLRVIENSGQLDIASFSPIVGSPSIDLSRNPQVIILVDWSDVAGDWWDLDALLNHTCFQLPPIGTIVSTRMVGDRVANYLLNLPLFSGHSLFELPIHVIGHSRGTSVNSQIAFDFAQHGIWIEHVTSLDAHPLEGDCGDMPVVTWRNTLFSDSYYRFVGGGYPTGFPVAGSHLVDLNGIITGDGLLTGGTAHEQVHTYYHGTIDLNLTQVDGVPIQDTWYDTGLYRTARNETGFAYDRSNPVIQHPDDGTHGELLGIGAINRSPVFPVPSNLPWPNVAIDDLQRSSNGYTVTAGDTVTFDLHYQDGDTQMDISLFKDDDTNPYNGHISSSPLAGPLTNAANNISIGKSTITWNTSESDVGEYYIQARATDGIHTRYDYLMTSVTVNSSAVSATTPDLTVLSVSSASQATPGSTVPVTFAVKNVGNGASGSFTNRISLATTTLGTQMGLVDYQMQSLGPNVSRIVTVNITVPPSISAGDYWVTVYADGPSPGLVAESNEGNNIGSTNPVQITIIPITYAITTNVLPTGGGTVTGGGNYPSGSNVTLVANQNTGYTFVNWTENGSPVSNSANFSFIASADRDIQANYIITPTLTYNLNISAINGTVVKNPDLSGYGDGSQVTLYASPVAGYKFSYWSGDANSTSPQITVTMDGNKNITANCIPINQETGSVRVSILPEGAVTAGAQWRFVGDTVWQLSGTIIPDISYGTYSIEFKDVLDWSTPANLSITISATNPTSWVNSGSYIQNSHDMIVSISGFGVVTSSPSGIDCNPVCQASFVDGSQVSLVADASVGWQFESWGGACNGTGSCSVLMTSIQNVTADFTSISGYDGDLAPWDNPDGQINAADVLIATQIVLGMRIPGPLQYAHGDMNQNGAIDLADLLLIQQIVLQ